MPRRKIHNGRRNKERRNFARAALQQFRVFAFNNVKPAHARPNMHAYPRRDFRSDLKPDIFMASSVAAMAKWMKRPIFLLLFSQ